MQWKLGPILLFAAVLALEGCSSGHRPSLFRYFSRTHSAGGRSAGGTKVGAASRRRKVIEAKATNQSSPPAQARDKHASEEARALDEEQFRQRLIEAVLDRRCEPVNPKNTQPN